MEEEKILVLKKGPYSMSRYAPKNPSEGEELTSAVEVETMSGNMKLTFYSGDAMCSSLMQMAAASGSDTASADYFSMWASMMHTLCHTVPDIEMFQELMECYKNYLTRLADLTATEVSESGKSADADDLRAVAASLGVAWRDEIDEDFAKYWSDEG